MRVLICCIVLGGLYCVLPLSKGYSQEPGKQFPKLEKELTTSGQDTTAIAFSPNGKLMASGSDGIVQLWNLETSKGETLLKRDRDVVIFSLAFSKDGDVLAIGDGSTLALWGIKEMRALKEFPKKELGVRSVALCDTGNFAVAAGLNVITMWSLKDYTKINEFDYTKNTEFKRKGYIRAVAVTEDGKMIATPGKGMEVTIIDSKSGDTLQSYSHGRSVNCLAIHKNDLLASGGNDDTIILWNIIDNKEKTRMRGHKTEVTSVAFSKDGKYLASASVDGVIILWNVATGKMETTFQASKKPITTLAFSPDGNLLASGGWDKGIKLWKLEKENK